jgi:uncharacterized protein (TIGR02001 family)
VPVRAPRRTIRNRLRTFDHAVRRGIVAVWLALVAADVTAQVSGTASLVSNYRFRGFSLSDDKPAAQLGITYDDAQGWYAGVFASTVKFATPSSLELQAVPFVGYAWRTATGLSWEVGADYSFFTGGAKGYDYPEVYVGVVAENISGRLYYSSHYFGESTSTLYGEINGTQLVFDRVHLLAHFGILHSTSGPLYYHGSNHLLDGRVGVGIDLDQFNVELSWVWLNSPNAANGVIGVSSHSGPVLTLSHSF